MISSKLVDEETLPSRGTRIVVARDLVGGMADELEPMLCSMSSDPTLTPLLVL